MEIQIETSSYNSRRYSKPWIARVDFSSSPKGDFHFGDFVGDDREGLLVIQADEGHVIAKGQKDYRNPRRTELEFFVVGGDGKLLETTRAQAYKQWKNGGVG